MTTDVNHPDDARTDAALPVASRIVLVAGVYTAVAGLVSFVGWLTDIPRLTDWDNNGISIQPNTTIAAMAAGAALILLAFDRKRASRALGAMAGLIGATALLQYLTGLNLGIDTPLLFGRTWGSRGTLAPGRMGPPASVSWTLVGTALWLILGGTKARRISAGLGVVVASIAALSLIGYAYGAHALYSVPWLTTIAVQTSSMLFVVGIGIIAAVPEHQPMCSVLEDSSAGTLTRRLLPLIVIVPGILGLVRVQGQNAGFYDTAMGTALLVLTLTGFLCAVLWWGAAAVRAHERALAEREERLRTTLASIGDGVITTDTDGRITSINAVAQSLTGWRTEEALDQPLSVVFRIINEQTRQPVENPAMRALREGAIVGLANHTILIAKDGTERPLDDSAAPIRCREGTLVGCVLVFRDVTVKRAAERALWESKTRKTAMLQIASDCIVSIDHEGRVLEFNSAAERTFGYRHSEAVGRELADLIIPPSLRDRHRQGLAHYLATGHGPILDQRIEMTAMRADGTEFPVELAVSRIPLDGPPMFTAFLRDITARKQAERQFRQYAADLSAADHRKNEFLAMLAHELRNPLAPIRNAVHALRLTGNDGEAVRSAAEILERQVSHMVRLIDDLLDVSRISLGKIELRKEQVELASAVNHAVETVRSLMQFKNQELIATLAPQPIFVHADPTRLAQVVGNLLNNACKFSTKGGHIWLTVEHEGNHAVIRVRDTGIGIAPDQLHSIFDMFTQVDTSLERSGGGLGIGLTLVKTLVEMHDGTVTAHSPGLGQGSEFVVRLPIVSEASTQPPQERPFNQAVSQTARRILVVDDNRDAAESLAVLFELSGHETLTAFDGIEAVEAAATFRPDLVLLDIGLPKLNGYEAARKIRAQPGGDSMRLVALTGWGQEQDRRKSLEAGFDGHLVKPVNYADLTKLLADILDTRIPDHGEGGR